MKTCSKISGSLALAATLPLISCATFHKSVVAVKNTTSTAFSKVGSGVSSLWPGSKIKVVDVREKDLKKLQSGDELAKNYRLDALKKNSFGSPGGKVYGPVDFTEPTLPAAGSITDGSLLPPRQ